MFHYTRTDAVDTRKVDKTTPAGRHKGMHRPHSQALQLSAKGRDKQLLLMFYFFSAEKTMRKEKIESVLSENLGEGYRIVRDNGELSAVIE